jgi:hypothetical protein
MTLAINLVARKSNLALGAGSTCEPLDLFNDFLLHAPYFCLIANRHGKLAFSATREE